MKKIVALILMLSLCLLLFPVSGYCGRINWGGTDRRIQLGRQLPYDLVYRGASRGGVSTIVSQVSTLSSTNLAFSILLLSGADKTFSIVEGSEIGQEITLVKSEYDARTLKLSLTADLGITHTGFTSVTWPTEAGSFVTLTWIDDTIGWMITGAHGVTITY